MCLCVCVVEVEINRDGWCCRTAGLDSQLSALGTSCRQADTGASLMTNQSTSHFLHPSNSVYTRAGATVAGGREERRTEGLKQATETETSFRAALQLPSTWEKWLFEQKINLESFNTLSCRGWDYSMFARLFKSQPRSQRQFLHRGRDYTSTLSSIDLIYCGGGQQVNTCKKEYVSGALGRRRGKEVNRYTC